MSTTRTASLHFKPFKEAGNDLMVELAGLCRSGESSRTARNFVAAMVEANAKPG